MIYFLYDMFYTSTRGGGRGSERSPSLGSAHQVSSRTITFNRMQQFKKRYRDLIFHDFVFAVREESWELRVTLVPCCLVAGNSRSANSLGVITIIININMIIFIVILMIRSLWSLPSSDDKWAGRVCNLVVETLYRGGGAKRDSNLRMILLWKDDNMMMI